ncbi:activator of 90 kDa heat shock protein ATPase homolog 1-like [Clavelina lepadiformis]|uniref:activator of 90 kDa heat shock protein ATPase homolog 1-like n=1 Tax=Clavelina lepadiformis TaxID=159417 RepID=UPI004042A6E3
MAKWGEGDPRWIVEERADAHNVNNWHWTERDASNWSKNKLKELLEGLKIVNDDVGSCVIHEVTSCDGEASVSNRKKKIICFYEFKVKAKWKGSLKGSDIKYVGELEIPNLSEENDADEVDVNISFGKDERECRELKDLMRKQGTKLIQSKLQDYIDSLKTECAATIQVPEKDASTSTNGNVAAGNRNNIKSEMQQVVVQESKADIGTRIHTKKLVMTETFMTEVGELYKTLTLKDRVSAWTRGSVSADVSVGQTFSFFGGNVSGEYTGLVYGEKIAMRWRHKSWPDAHFSNVTLNLKQTSDGAQIRLEQKGVPQDSIEATRMGWKNYYWSAIKMTFGFGTRIL